MSCWPVAEELDELPSACWLCTSTARISELIIWKAEARSLALALLLDEDVDEVDALLELKVS